MRSRCVEIRVECSKVDSQMLENSLPLPTRPDQISRVPFDFPSIDSPPLVEESFTSTRLRGSTQIYSRRLRKIVSNQQVFDEVALFLCASQNACSSIGCNCGYMFRSIKDRRIVGNVFGFWIILLRRRSSPSSTSTTSFLLFQTTAKRRSSHEINEHRRNRSSFIVGI